MRASYRVLAPVAAIVALLGCGAEAQDPPAQKPPEQKPAQKPAAPSAPATPKPAGAQGGASPSNAATVSFDSSRAWEHLRRQVAIGPRPSGSAANAETRRYILDTLRAAGIEGREQPFEAQTPIGPIKMANIVATIPGARTERIALGTHFDTKLEKRFRFVGASDGASSTAAVLELGRVLAQRKNPYTIELLFFDGEEAVVEWTGNDHTYGSRHYVTSARSAGTLRGLKALILLDLIGDRDLRIKKESNSTGWLTDLIWDAAARLGYERYFVDEEFAIGGDDHFEFLAAGVPAVDIIDLDYAAWHTPNDDLNAVSARSLQVVGDVVLAALPALEKRLAGERP